MVLDGTRMSGTLDWYVQFAVELLFTKKRKFNLPLSALSVFRGYVLNCYIFVRRFVHKSLEICPVCSEHVNGGIASLAS